MARKKEYKKLNLRLPDCPVVGVNPGLKLEPHSLNASHQTLPHRRFSFNHLLGEAGQI